LKKQSQFAFGQIGVRSYLKGHYDKIPLCGSRKNKANQSQSYLAPSTAGDLKTNLKKQSQFAFGQIGVSSYLKGYYDKIPLCGTRKNKAKQSQFI
jgi:hypothetical protein